VSINLQREVHGFPLGRGDGSRRRHGPEDRSIISYVIDPYRVRRFLMWTEEAMAMKLKKILDPSQIHLRYPSLSSGLEPRAEAA